MLDRKSAEELKIPFALIFSLKISLTSISFHSEIFYFQPRNFFISFVSCLISDGQFFFFMICSSLDFLFSLKRFSKDPVSLTTVFHDKTFKTKREEFFSGTNSTISLFTPVFRLASKTIPD